MLAYAQTLQHEITQQQKQISAGYHTVLAAKAKVAAGKVVAYGQQAQNDQRTATTSAQKAATSYDNLTKILPKDVSFRPGNQPLTQAQIDGLLLGLGSGRPLDGPFKSSSAAFEIEMREVAAQKIAARDLIDNRWPARKSLPMP
jgi:hypothetical protein